jgi:inhibitor of KinA
MRIFPLGENALTVEFGSVISTQLNDQALTLAAHFDSNPFPGFIEAVPAYSSTTIFYDLTKINAENDSTVFATLQGIVEFAIGHLSHDLKRNGRRMEIPVSLAPNDSLDLSECAEMRGLQTNEFIEIFTAGIYRVYMIGFLPGFAYMGEVDERIEVPRKSTPRQSVPKGSVGIAGRQTGIYPLESPGGWQIIGRTDIEMFSPGSDEPCYLIPGDEVRFVPVRI